MDQQIAVTVGIHAWGYDRIDASPELEGEGFDMVIKTRRDPPGYFGICKPPGTACRPEHPEEPMCVPRAAPVVCQVASMRPDRAEVASSHLLGGV